MSDDLLTRSTAHWSEDRRAGMDAFYRLATDDYRFLAQARDWAAWLSEAQFQTGGRGLRLMDVACGSGKFPNALVRHAGVGEAGLLPIATDLLDPSAFSIAEARAALPAPFTPAAEHLTTLQDFIPPSDGYDVVWATHALYAVPADELPLAAARFGAANAEPYISAEMLADALRAAGATVAVTELRYDSTARPDDTKAVEGYLQRCVFDDSVSMARMENASGLADYLAACRTAAGWRFPQIVHLIDVSP